MPVLQVNLSKAMTEILDISKVIYTEWILSEMTLPITSKGEHNITMILIGELFVIMEIST